MPFIAPCTLVMDPDPELNIVKYYFAQWALVPVARFFWAVPCHDPTYAIDDKIGWSGEVVRTEHALDVQWW